MVSLKQFFSEDLSRAGTVSRLRALIFNLALCSLLLGIELSNMARALGHGDPYHTAHWTEFAVCIAVAAIISIAFQIRRSIHRLEQLDNQQAPQPAPH